jgi:hypothetical protein
MDQLLSSAPRLGPGSAFRPYGAPSTAPRFGDAAGDFGPPGSVNPTSLAGSLASGMAAPDAPAAGIGSDPIARAMCRPNVGAFVNAHRAAATALAKELGSGATPQQILALAGMENTYGADPKAAVHGNYFGIQAKGADPQDYFAGQTGTVPTARDGSLAAYPPDTGFYWSGRRAVDLIRPHVGSQDLSNPDTFFALANTHGFGKDNPDYLKTVSGAYNLVGRCM